MNQIDEMQRHLLNYFRAEKTESLFFIAVGIAAIAASIFIFIKYSDLRGIVIPLVLIALIQISVGGAVFFRTDSQVANLTKKLTTDAAGYAAEESARMETVMKNFMVYKIIEIGLLAAGIALTFLFKNNNFLYSLGIGLIIQPAFMLALDLLAEKRGSEYLHVIRSLFQ